MKNEGFDENRLYFRAQICYLFKCQLPEELPLNDSISIKFLGTVCIMLLV